GAGVILISGHIGAWEMGWLTMTHCGYPVSAVYRPQRRSELTGYLDQMRRWHGLHLIPESAPLECLAALRGGRILLLCVDVKPHQGGLMVPFFGHPRPEEHTSELQ